MKNLIKDNFDLLFVLSRNKNYKINKLILKDIDITLVKAVCECITNVERDIVPLPDNFTQKVKPYEKVIKKLIDSKVSLQTKKTLLKQNGSKLLPLILPPVVKYLSFLISE